MLSCKDVSRLVSESLDRHLSWRERMGLWLHLTMCRLCKRFRREVVAVHEQLREMPEPPDSSEVASEVRLPEDARKRIQASLAGRDQ